MSNIPLARTQLETLAKSLDAAGMGIEAARLRRIVNRHLFRVKAIRRAPIHSKPVTPAIKRRVKRLAANPVLHNSEIASKVGVNPGRVSEILHGKI